MNKLILILSLTLLTGCIGQNDHNATLTRCKNGVLYYDYYASNKGYLAPVYDKDTKEIILCNGLHKY